MMIKGLLAGARTLGWVCLGMVAACDGAEESVGGVPAEEALNEEPLLEMDPELLEAIAEAPELADADVEALFASSEPTVRDVIHLVDLDALPSGLTLDDLDAPVALDLGEAPERAVVIDAVGEFTAEIDPMAFGELACATTSIADPQDGATISMSPSPSSGFVYDGAVSPDGGYNPSGCPYQFITQVNGTYGRALSFYWGWHGPSLGAPNCDTGMIWLSAYGGRWVIKNLGGAWFFTLDWTKFGTTHLRAYWSTGGFWPGCYWEYAGSNAPLPGLSSGHNYDRVRTAAQAFSPDLWPSHLSVESGVRHGPGWF